MVMIHAKPFPSLSQSMISRWNFYTQCAESIVMQQNRHASASSTKLIAIARAYRISLSRVSLLRCLRRWREVHLRCGRLRAMTDLRRFSSSDITAHSINEARTQRTPLLIGICHCKSRRIRKSWCAEMISKR